jgi:hypothetical protein
MPVMADGGLMVSDVEGEAGLPVETVIVGMGACAIEIEKFIPAETSRPGTTMKGPTVIIRGTYRQGCVTDDPFSIE